MKRHKSFRSTTDDQPSLDISSLIDVCFLLLIYFLVATTIQKKEVDVPSHFATEPNSLTPLDIDPLMISIHNNGTISCGSEKSAMILDSDPSSRHLPLLEAQVGQYKEHLGTRQPLVQIRVEENVNQQRVMDVLNAMLAKDIKQVAFLDQP
jgi:biopolymer transport protein ExbD